jgi:ABC-type nitrate/sulfonate/bicarbonate transport system substrate-binding protein
VSTPPTVELIAFPGAPNLPIFAALEKGWFSESGIDLKLTTTPSSAFQAENLANGKFQIAGTAFDNVVAYQEGQGAVALPEKPDFFAFMGATQVELALITAPQIASHADIKGKSLALDALATGFAFVLYEMLGKAGVTDGDYKKVPVGATPQRWESVRDGTHVGTLTIEPFTSIARSQGFRVLDTSTRHFPVYQGGSFAARRSWAEEHPNELRAFIRGYLRGLDWVLDPTNRAGATALLLQRMPEIKPGVAEAVMTSLLSSQSGLTPKAKMLMDGVKVVLELRTRYVPQAQPLTDASRYVDLSYYDSVVPH